MKECIVLLTSLYRATKSQCQDLVSELVDLGAYRNICIGLVETLTESQFDELVASFEDTDTTVRYSDDTRKIPRDLKAIVTICKPSDHNDFINA